MPRLYQPIVIIRRSGNGVFDDRNQEGTTLAVVETTKGYIEPRSAVEQAQLNQAGAVASDHVIHMLPTADVREADVIRRDPDDGRRYEIEGIRSFEAGLRHKEVDARLITA